ncbi:sensor histidine kinase [Methyloferula stellata]|uniref:sensor histidine kinase n=1 Tax=Methyloferula stellata TaxID=876270 RepID=UPI00036BDB12|nr:HAMP domain-containing sensor histidine kinase [Methyloferula stellata]
MRLTELLRAGTFRVAIFFALAVTLSTSVVFLFIYWQVATFDIKRIEVRLPAEVAKALTEPEDRLKQALDLRLTRDLRLIDYAGLFDAQGRFIYGNIAMLPDNLPIDGASHAVEATLVGAPAGTTEPGLFVAGKRPDGSIVLLGRSLYEVYALRQLVVHALLIGIVPAIVLALLTGLIFSWRSAQRLLAINQTIVRIMHGDLYERLPTRGNRDDIDYVAAAVNLMLDEIVRLLDQIKSVGDNIAHDLRTPLAVARIKLERALESDEDDGLRVTAQHILSDLDHAMTTVTALLRISEVESGRRRSHFKLVDLAEICADVFDLYEPLAEAKSIVMSLDAPAPVQVMGDFDLLIEAVANLVDNAIKFAPRGSEVSIVAKMIDHKPVVRIADRGPGIAPEDRDNIFKRFYRSNQNSDLPGNGLGLSMAATIVEQHGLSLRAKDNGPGALFEIAKREESELSTVGAEAKPLRKNWWPLAGLTNFYGSPSDCIHN